MAAETGLKSQPAKGHQYRTENNAHPLFGCKLEHRSKDRENVRLMSLDRIGERSAANRSDRYHKAMPPTLKDMNTWTGRTGHDQLRSFVTEDGTFWLEQNANKTSKWSKLARQGHNIAWEFGANRRYTGRLLIDGEIYTPSEATKKFLQKEG